MFRKESVCTIRFSGKMCGSLRSRRICRRPLAGNNRRMTLQIDRSSRATRISFPTGDFSPFFFFFIRIFPFPPRHFSRPSCRYTVLKRVLKTATVFRSFVEDFHLNVIPASLLHRRDLHKFLSSEGREKKFVQPATICEQFLYRD